MVSPVPGMRCRQIDEPISRPSRQLLARGFPNRNRAILAAGFCATGAARAAAGFAEIWLPSGNQRRVVVGAILLICSTMRPARGGTARCNLSSWYVEPAFRAYAPMLVSQALRHKDVTYLNVSAAPHTWPIIEAQGFSRYSERHLHRAAGVERPVRRARVEVFDASTAADGGVRSVRPGGAAAARRARLHQPVVRDGERAYPFVFRPRLVKDFIPCAQLIYCRDIGDFVRFAGPIGRHLARRGKPVVIDDSNGPIPGLVGIFSRGKMPKYFKGPQRPRLGDLAYTEYAWARSSDPQRFAHRRGPAFDLAPWVVNSASARRSMPKATQPVCHLRRPRRASSTPCRNGRGDS
jgi:hypothetical protein